MVAKPTSSGIPAQSRRCLSAAQLGRSGRQDERYTRCQQVVNASAHGQVLAMWGQLASVQ